MAFGRARRIKVFGGVVHAHSDTAFEAWDAATGQQLWSLPGHAMAGPVDGPVLYTSADKKICAVDARTGEVRWERRFAEKLLGRLRSRGATAPVDRVHPLPGGHVLAYGGGGVHALDADTGALRWAHPADFGGKAAAVGLGGVLDATGRPLLLGPTGEPGELIALDPESGDRLWSRKHAIVVAFPDGRACAISGRDSSGQHHLLDSVTGAMLGPVGGTSENPLAFPGLVGDTAVIRQDEFCERIELATGSRIWRTQMRSISRCRTGWVRDTVVTDAAVYIPDEKTSFHALDVEDGAVLWHAADVLDAPDIPDPSGPLTQADPAPRLFGGPDTALAVGPDASTAFDRRTGRTLWTWADPHRTALDEEAAAPRYVTSAALGHGAIYLGGERRLFAVPVPAPPV
ncbi:PQQ-like beta-propeller repeat protein [Yinghuangia soli]|uniref:PQQ-like beta-propeller repeat protein n=1 Tax=Yinghuangia soli TaxID=2908204 RepID=UPI001F3242D1|nr:PQQ-like beta-propeller repeat protein [Yinghuangia soli]